MTSLPMTTSNLAATTTTLPKTAASSKSLVGLIRYLLAALKVGEGQIVASLRKVFVDLLQSPYVKEFLKLVFLDLIAVVVLPTIILILDELVFLGLRP